MSLGPQLSDGPAERVGDGSAVRLGRDHEAMDPTPDLSGVDADALSEPCLAASVLVECLLEPGVQSGTFHVDTKRSPTLPVLSSALYTTCIRRVPKLIAELLPELRDGMSRDRLVREMARAGYDVSPGAIKAIETQAGRVPQARIMEGIAVVLGVPPDTFYEWPIAAARASSDTRSTADRAAQEALEIAEAAARQLEGTRKQTGAAKRRRGAGGQPL